MSLLVMNIQKALGRDLLKMDDKTDSLEILGSNNSNPPNLINLRD